MIEYGVKIKLGLLSDPDDIEADPVILHNIVDRLLEYCTSRWLKIDGVLL